MKRYLKLLVLPLCVILLAATLCACSGEGAPTDYASENCNHVWGEWHDAVETAEDSSATPAGQVRYCKICGAEERQ